MGEIKKMQGRLSAWLAKHGLVHRSLGFDYQGIETLQIKLEDWHSIVVILYVYDYNYLCSTISSVSFKQNLKYLPYWIECLSL